MRHLEILNFLANKSLISKPLRNLPILPILSHSEQLEVNIFFFQRAKLLHPAI